jgi:DNA-binding XRE family transcriptional regulator
MNDRLIIRGVVAFIGKAARRFAGLGKKELDQIERLSLLLRGASEDEQTEIIEAIAEVIFPEDLISGVINPDNEVSDEARIKLTRYRKAVGEQIRKRRDQLEMTQEELAQKAGIPQSHVSRLECGQHAPTHITIKKIARALKTEPSQLDPGFPTEE